MGFLAKSRDWLKLRAKQAQVKKSPDPIVLSELVQCLLRLKDLDAAYEHVSWGMKRFPDSDVVQETHRIVVREKARLGVQQATKEIQESPSPMGFMRLAKSALQLRDGETAGKALRECVRRFPDCGPAHSLLAEIHERRFLRDLAVSDGMAVISFAQKACRLDPTDVDTQLRLARFLGMIGAVSMARKLATAILARDSRRSDARELVDSLPDNPPAQKPDEIGEMLARIEEDGRLPGDGSEEYRIQREVGKLCRGIREVKEKLRARRSIVLNPECEAFDDLGPLGVDAFVDLSANLSQSAQLLCRRTELGPLRGVTLEGAGGSLVVRRGFRCVVGCLLPRDGTILGSQESLRVLVEAAAGGRNREVPA